MQIFGNAFNGKKYFENIFFNDDKRKQINRVLFLQEIWRLRSIASDAKINLFRRTRISNLNNLTSFIFGGFLT